MKNVILENFRNEIGDFTTDIICSDCNKPSEVYIETQTDNGSPLIRLCKTCINMYSNMIDKAIIKKCKSGGI